MTSPTTDRESMDRRVQTQPQSLRPTACISFTVRGIPKGQPRPRAFAVKIGGKFTTRAYDPGTAEGWKALVVAAGVPHRPASPIDGPIAVYIDLYFPRPGRLGRRTSPDGPLWHLGRPDSDNAAKAILDSLTQDGWWRDDSLVCRLMVRKYYHAKGDTPGAVIQVEELRQP